MYTLRIISWDKAQENFFLGKSYKLIEADKNKTLFESYNDERKAVLTSSNGDAFAFVISHDNEVFPLILSNQCYIMTSEGNTFAKIFPVASGPETCNK